MTSDVDGSDAATGAAAEAAAGLPAGACGPHHAGSGKMSFEGLIFGVRLSFEGLILGGSPSQL
ncbi:hypothetical protein J2S43_002369 [Catenuloplanes nepalensis]|uniref:Uncharacterized protein n=1 Tax=Catenuloplanes nepalensis TaxID=587533 RepID=A0ABT9MR00_9ACTN|nr:hypothetical protein [Catenuloplanes nepalensis]MDP9793857.1 hypothetical protein [Catenuloplanes nepalensis]